MTSREFYTQVVLIFLLISISTGLSLFDKKSYFQKFSRQTIEQEGLTAHITPVQLEGGGEKENENNASYPSDKDEPFIESERSPEVRPFRNWNIPDPSFSAFSGLIWRPSDGRIFYQKNIAQAFPIASLTKLMTALVVIGHLDLEDVVTVSSNAVATEGEAGNLVVGERITVKNLLYAILVESSNDAAVALEEYFNVRYPETPLVEAMNRKAAELGLSSTIFKNPSGLDAGGIVSNSATASDLALLGMYILNNNPVIMDTIAITSIDVQSVDGRYNHHLVNSNKLLGVLPEVIGGKTGYTEKAGESLITFFLSSSSGSETLISIVLRSQDRTGDTKILLNWVKEAYRWE